VVMTPSSFEPRFLCTAVLDLQAQGRSCSLNACPAGYRCEETSSGSVCSLPCPGGAADCPSGSTCQMRSFAPLLQSGATVPLCVPG
jgi:hypothetical protein